jgi:hypothetical protein
MTEFLQRFRQAWRLAKVVPAYTPEAQGTWDRDDAQWLANFFKSHTGYKLKLLLQNHAHTTALWATQQPQSNLYKAAGIAVGISNVLTFIASHEQIPSAPDEQEQSEPDEEQAALSEFVNTA